MPKCERCGEFLPPNYVEVIPDSKPLFNGEYPKECVFCQKLISEVERETAQGSGKFVPYTKEQCVKDYKNFLTKLKNSGKVQDIMNKTDNIKGIKF